MSEANYASLGPTLLARKGGAKPAMRPQLAALTADEATGPAAAANLEDLGWNDMGEDDKPHDGHIVHLTPCNEGSADDELVEQPEAKSPVADEPPVEKPVVRRQQEKIASRFVQDNDEEHEDDADEAVEAVVEPSPPARSRRVAKPSGRRAAFTLRLDGERHLKLRLASTIRNASAQALVTEALDKLLREMPEINSLAAQVKRPQS